MHQLILQGTCACRDHDPSIGECGWHQIRERLAGSSSGLDERGPVVLERTRGDFGHADLRRAMLIFRGRLHEQTMLPEHITRDHAVR